MGKASRPERKDQVVMNRKIAGLTTRTWLYVIPFLVIMFLVIIVVVVVVTVTCSDASGEGANPSASRGGEGDGGLVAPSASSPYQAQLDPSYKLLWDFNKTHIAFQVVVRTTGYVGFGISGNGKMFPADVVVGWVNDDGSVHLEDMRTTSGYNSLEADSHQDWHLISGSETSGVTSLRFYRKLDTCDDVTDDIAILEGTTRVIYSYGPADAASYHEDRRGTKSLLLLEPPASSENVEKHPLPADIEAIEFLNGNFTIPNETTYYHCTTHEISQKLSGKKHHMIKYEPVVTRGNEKLVHHIVLNYCSVRATE